MVWFGIEYWDKAALVTKAFPPCCISARVLKPTDSVFFIYPLVLVVSDSGWTVMTARFRLPAGRSYNVRASELARDRQHTEVVCNIVLLDNTVQPFKVNVSTLKHCCFLPLVCLVTFVYLLRLLYKYTKYYF